MVSLLLTVRRMWTYDVMVLLGRFKCIVMGRDEIDEKVVHSLDHPYGKTLIWKTVWFFFGEHHNVRWGREGWEGGQLLMVILCNMCVMLKGF